MKSTLFSTALLALPVLAADVPADAKDYAAVDAAITRALTAIRADLVKLGEAGTVPQLDGIKGSKISKSKIGWTYSNLCYAKAATWVMGDKFEFGKDGCRINVDLRSYNAESDPRCGIGAASASPGPHFQVKSTGVPFGIRVTVEAGPTREGRAFTERVGAVVSTRLDTLKQDLGAVPVEWNELVDKNDPLDRAELEKEAFVVLEGTVTGRSAEVYQETGQPQRIQVKVTAIHNGKPNHKGRLKVGDTVPIDPWLLKPAVEFPVGTTIKAYLDMGHVQHAPNELRPFYYPVAPNAINVTSRQAPPPSGK